MSFFNFAQGCQRVVEDWQKILQVRSLVLSPQEDMKSWLKYASLCRKSGRLALSHKTLVTLLGTDPSKQADQPLPTTYPQVTFAYMKHMWNENKKVWEDPPCCFSVWVLSLKRNRYVSVWSFHFPLSKSRLCVCALFKYPRGVFTYLIDVCM